MEIAAGKTKEEQTVVVAAKQQWEDAGLNSAQAITKIKCWFIG